MRGRTKCTPPVFLKIVNTYNNKILTYKKQILLSIGIYTVNLFVPLVSYKSKLICQEVIEI